MNPSSITANDNEGKTPVHLLCQGTLRGVWDVKSNPTVEKNMIGILRMLHNKVPSCIVLEDNEGVGSIEYAIQFNLGIEFITELQTMIANFNEKKAIKLAHKRCMLARRELSRQKSPRAAFAA